MIKGDNRPVNTENDRKKILESRSCVDEVIIFDKNNNAEDYAKTVGTISYEILTNLSERIERKIIG